MNMGGQRASWVMSCVAGAFIIGYLAKYGGVSYARTAAPAPPPAIAAPMAPRSVDPPVTPAPVKVAPVAAPAAVVQVASPPPQAIPVAPAPPAKAVPKDAGAAGRKAAVPEVPPTATPAKPADPPIARPEAAAPSSEPPALPAPDLSAAAANAPRIKFEQPNYDFGTVYQQEKVTHEFVFRNTGKAPLRVTNVITTCSCTVGKIPKAAIAPGQKGKIPVTFESGRLRNRITKHLIVESNDPVEPRVAITLTGEVKIEADMVPTGIYFGRLPVGSMVDRSVTIKPVGTKRFSVLEVKSPDPGITLVTPLSQLKPAGDGSYTLTFRIGPYPAEKQVRAEVTIRTDLKHQAQLPLPVYGRVGNAVAPASMTKDATQLAP